MDIRNENHPCLVFRGYRKDTAAEFKKSDRMRIVFVPGYCGFKHMSRLWSISRWESPTLLTPEGKVGGRRAKGVCSAIEVSGDKYSVDLSTVQMESHKGECPLECSGKFPDPEEYCITFSNSCLSDSLRTETPLRVVVENYWEHIYSLDSVMITCACFLFSCNTFTQIIDHLV